MGGPIGQKNSVNMKFLVAVAALIALASGQHPTEEPDLESCHCGVFVATDAGELEIHHMHPAEPVVGCEPEECRAACSEEWTLAAGEGDLDEALANGNTLGAELCKSAEAFLHPEIHDAIPMVYFRSCDEGWVPTGDQALDYLCCDDGIYHHCDHTHPPM